MKKPDGLRRLLLATALKDQGEKLTTFIDRGGLKCRRGRNLNFEYRYTLSIFVAGYTGSTNALLVPVLAWIAEQQPDLLEKDQAFTFEAEVLDDNSADVTIDIEISENVAVTRTGPSTFEAVHIDEPVIDDTFPNVCGVSLVQGLVDAGGIVG